MYSRLLIFLLCFLEYLMFFRCYHIICEDSVTDYFSLEFYHFAISMFVVIKVENQSILIDWKENALTLFQIKIGRESSHF